MKKIIILFFFLFSFVGKSQYFEIGPDVAYWNTNIFRIENSNHIDIGKNLPSLNLGATLYYYLKNPNKDVFGRIGLLYRHHSRGSNSFRLANHKFEYKSNIVGLTVGLGIGLGKTMSLHGDLGLGYNFIDHSTKHYFGDSLQVRSFFELLEPITLKQNELLFLFGFTLEKILLKNRLKVFLYFSADLGLTKLNETGVDHLRSYSGGFGMGARYVIKYIPHPFSTRIYASNDNETPIYRDDNIPQPRSTPSPQYTPPQPRSTPRSVTPTPAPAPPPSPRSTNPM